MSDLESPAETYKFSVARGRSMIASFDRLADAILFLLTLCLDRGTCYELRDYRNKKSLIFSYIELEEIRKNLSTFFQQLQSISI